MNEPLSQADDIDPSVGRRAGITSRDVWDAAEALARAGTPVTTLRIREQLGHRGSLTTIGKYFNEWKSARRNALSGESGLTPDGAKSDAMSEYLKLAMDSARKELRALAMNEAEEIARERWEREFAALEQAREDLDQRKAELERAHALREADLDARIQQNAAYLDRLPALISETVARQVAAELNRLLPQVVAMQAEQIADELHRMHARQDTLKASITTLKELSIEAIERLADRQAHQAQTLSAIAAETRSAQDEVLSVVKSIQAPRRTRKVVRSNRFRDPGHSGAAH